MPRMPLPAPAIIGKQAKSTAYRARDVRADIRELGFERGIERAVTMQADEMVGMRQTIGELAGIVDQLVNRLLEMGQVNEALVKQIDSLRKRDERYEEAKGHMS